MSNYHHNTRTAGFAVPAAYTNCAPPPLFEENVAVNSYAPHAPGAVNTNYVHNPYAMPLPSQVYQSSYHRPAPVPEQRQTRYQPPRCSPQTPPEAESPIPSPTTSSQASHSSSRRSRRNKKEKQPVCLDYLHGVCHLKRWKCKYAHPPLSLINGQKKRAEALGQVCEVYLLTGFCKFGDTCRDLHPDIHGPKGPLCAPAKVKTDDDDVARSCTGSDGLDERSSTVGSDSAGSLSTLSTASTLTPPSSPGGGLVAPCCPGHYHSHSHSHPANSNNSSSVHPTTSTQPNNKTYSLGSTEGAIRKVNGILNRLTPERFDSLLQQLFELLTGEAEACLSRVLPLVFARAVAEPNMCQLYARLTKHLYSLVSSDEQPLLCEQLRSLSANLLFNVGDLLEVVVDASQKAKLQAKRLGNVKFLGELISHEILPYQTLQEIVEFILQEARHENDEGDFHLELLAHMLTTTGSGLQSLYPSYVHYMVNMCKKLSMSGVHSTRVKMLVMNVVDRCQ